jgi:hypothetical protein
MMPFLDADDRLIIMDINRSTYDHADPDYSLKADEMKRLREAGIRTVLQQMWWRDIERGGRRDWTLVDIGIDRAREAGLKVLLQCYQMPPADLPADWYMRTENGEGLEYFSIWNDQAADYEEAFVRDLAARYAGDDVLLMNSLVTDGETLLVLEPSWFDPAARASYNAVVGPGSPPNRLKPVRAQQWNWIRDSMICKMVQYQALLLEVQAHDEIWMSMHPWIQHNPNTGTQFTHDILRALREAFPDVSIMWMLYTFYELPLAWRKEQFVYAEHNQIGVVTGAMHCQGLARTVPAAKFHGHRLLCGPRHNHILPDQVDLEDWQLEKERDDLQARLKAIHDAAVRQLFFERHAGWPGEFAQRIIELARPSGAQGIEQETHLTAKRKDDILVVTWCTPDGKVGEMTMPWQPDEAGA